MLGFCQKIFKKSQKSLKKRLTAMRIWYILLIYEIENRNQFQGQGAPAEKTLTLTLTLKMNERDF